MGITTSSSSRNPASRASAPLSIRNGELSSSSALPTLPDSFAANGLGFESERTNCSDPPTVLDADCCCCCSAAS